MYNGALENTTPTIARSFRHVQFPRIGWHTSSRDHGPAMAIHISSKMILQRAYNHFTVTSPPIRDKNTWLVCVTQDVCSRTSVTQ